MSNLADAAGTDGFGPVVGSLSTKFRVTSKVKSNTSKPVKLFAVCDGRIPVFVHIFHKNLFYTGLENTKCYFMQVSDTTLYYFSQVNKMSSICFTQVVGLECIVFTLLTSKPHQLYRPKSNKNIHYENHHQ
ncbi:hypothetical protein [Chryseobacterium koreense]|uniref:hypothetical protein n=1 Tax=Chryseobacterium koreense TaxID=232216 RepID=UPI00128C3CB6|nr:hypothetical protein [Chryseobacterium koreense]MBB5332905.1 hypothetical protein [Chryseobacterium koreense]